MYYIKSTLNWMGGYSTTQTSAPTDADEIKPPETKPEEGTFGGTLWQIIGKQLGSDVLRIGISLPSWMYEPLSSIQRHTEMLEYGEILNRAAKCPDPVERMAHVVGFAVTAYSATRVRLRPTFNPILGETYEYIDRKTNMKFFAEQVSHHPPVTAVHVEGNGWTFFQNSSPSTKFLGNSLDLLTQGNTHIQFPEHGDHIHYTNPCTRVNSIIIGTRWMEHFGNLNVKNMKNGISSTVVFRKAGLFQGPQYEISGVVVDINGNTCVEIEGRWDQYVNAKWLVDTANRKAGEIVEIWRIPEGNFIENHPFGFTQFAATLNTMDDDMEWALLASDSRRRLDRLHLEKGDYDTATKWKRVMEEKQRSDRKSRKETWNPVWFHETEVPVGAVTMGLPPSSSSSSPSSSSTTSSTSPQTVGDFPSITMWTHNGSFWTEKDKREKANDGQYFVPAHIAGQACDFTSYEPKVSPTTTDTTLTDTDGSDDNTPPQPQHSQ